MSTVPLTVTLVRFPSFPAAGSAQACPASRVTLLPRTIPVRGSPCLAGLLGNQHGSLCCCYGSWGYCGIAEPPHRVPGTPVRPDSSPIWIGLGTGKINCFVVDPLPDISLHIKKAPLVGRILTHIAGLFKIIFRSRNLRPNYN